MTSTGAALLESLLRKHESSVEPRLKLEPSELFNSRKKQHRLIQLDEDLIDPWPSADFHLPTPRGTRAKRLQGDTVSITQAAPLPTTASHIRYSSALSTANNNIDNEQVQAQPKAQLGQILPSSSASRQVRRGTQRGGKGATVVSFYRVENLSRQVRQLIPGPAIQTRTEYLLRFERRCIARRFWHRWRSYVAAAAGPALAKLVPICSRSAVAHWQAQAISRAQFRIELAQKLSEIRSQHEQLQASREKHRQLLARNKQLSAAQSLFVSVLFATTRQAFSRWYSNTNTKARMHEAISRETDRMGMEREDSSWRRPWCAALHLRLPALPARGVEARPDGGSAVVDRSRFVRFRRFIRGPTDASSWLIKGAHTRLLFGAYPHGQARSTDPTITARSTAVAQLLLHGIDTFIHFLNSHELRRIHPSKSYSDHADATLAALRNDAELKAAAATTAAAYARKRFERGRQIGYGREQLGTLERTFLAREKARREAQASLDELPEQLQHVQLPLPKGGVAKDVELEQVCAIVEMQLRQGKGVYLFSSDGRGRAAAVGAAVLGRLYGLDAEEALQRVQDYHDAQERNEQLPFGKGFSCPALASQAAQVRRVVRRSLVAYHPTKRRIHTNCGEDTWEVRPKRQREGLPVYKAANVLRAYTEEQRAVHAARRMQRCAEVAETRKMRDEEQAQRDEEIDRRCLRRVQEDTSNQPLDDRKASASLQDSCGAGIRPPWLELGESSLKAHEGATAPGKLPSL